MNWHSKKILKFLFFLYLFFLLIPSDSYNIGRGNGRGRIQFLDYLHTKVISYLQKKTPKTEISSFQIKEKKIRWTTPTSFSWTDILDLRWDVQWDKEQFCSLFKMHIYRIKSEMRTVFTSYGYSVLCYS